MAALGRVPRHEGPVVPGISSTGGKGRRLAEGVKVTAVLDHEAHEHLVATADELRCTIADLVRAAVYRQQRLDPRLVRIDLTNTGWFDSALVCRRGHERALHSRNGRCYKCERD